MSFSPLELLLIGSIVIPSLWVLLWSWWSSSLTEIFSPRVFFTVIMLYYTVGPVFLVLRTDAEMFGISLRPILWKGWLAAALAYTSFLLGYRKRWRPERGIKFKGNETITLILASTLFGTAACAMFFWMFRYGGGFGFLNPFYTENSMIGAGEGFESALAVYVVQFINLSFGGVFLLLLYWLERRSFIALVLLLGASTFALLFFIKTGFRYRIVWMATGYIITYYLWTRKRPNLLFWVPVAVLFVTFMGIIGQTRNYWGGLNFEKTSGLGWSDSFANGFSESGTFFITCQVIDAVPDTLPYTYFDPFWVALTYPIPRKWWAEKPDSRNLMTMSMAFGGKGAAEAGLAMPYFGDWYVAFGWLGVVGSSLLFGRLARVGWEWYRAHDRDKLAVAIYGVGLGFIYVVFSRGLLAQAVLNFSFGLLPLMIIYRFLPKITLVITSLTKRPDDMPPEPQARLRSANVLRR
jgi:hypothetical protein